MSLIIGAVRYVNKFRRLTSINDSNKFASYLTWHTLFDTVEFSLKCLKIDITIQKPEEFRMVCSHAMETFSEDLWKYRSLPYDSRRSS